jgi:hypothetical protein
MRDEIHCQKNILMAEAHYNIHYVRMLGNFYRIKNSTQITVE